MEPGYLTVNGERREVPALHLPVASDRRDLVEGWETVNGERRRWFGARGVPYLIGQATQGSNAVAYRMAVSGDTVAFSALPSTLDVPGFAFLESARIWDDLVWVAATTRLYSAPFTDDGFGTPTVRTRSGGQTGSLHGLLRIGAQTYALTGRDLYSIAYTDSTYTATLQATTGDALGTTLRSGGATAETGDGSIYLIGNNSDFMRQITAARLSPTLAVTALTVSGDTNVSAMPNTGAIEAALAVGDVIYIFGLDSRRIWRATVSGDTMTCELLTSQAPDSTRFWAAFSVPG